MNTQLIEQFIREELLQGRLESIGADEPLISAGLIDSLGMLRLIGFIEEELHVQIGDGEVTPDNFETLNSIAVFLEKKK